MIMGLRPEYTTLKISLSQCYRAMFLINPLTNREGFGVLAGFSARFSAR